MTCRLSHVGESKERHGFRCSKASPFVPILIVSPPVYSHTVFLDVFFYVGNLCWNDIIFPCHLRERRQPGNCFNRRALWYTYPMACNARFSKLINTSEEQYTPCCRCPVTMLYSCVMGNLFGNRALERNGLTAERSQP